ncbi:hypothetical protein LXL04_036955 [Taraxacum kok-saghyz]
MPELIEGLPDAVAIRCLARVPYRLFPKLETVCHSWRDAIRSNELVKAREEVNSTEDFLCVSAFDPENIWQIFDPNRAIWITLPILPSKVKNLTNFGVVSTAGKLFVLGGGSDAVDPLTGDQDGSFATNEVWAYDPVLRRWSSRAAMVVPRAMFACCVVNGKILVAGGFTTCRKSIARSELYDPETDTWAPIPDLNYTHNSACSGVVLGGEVHVVHKGLTTVQVLKKDMWWVHEHAWVHGPMTVVNGSLYVMTHGVIYKQESESRKVVVSASEFKRRIGCAMVGFQGDIYVIGGVIGPVGWNWDIRKMSDVDVLTLGSERPVWQKAVPMTRCRGTILGCAVMRI